MKKRYIVFNYDDDNRTGFDRAEEIKIFPAETTDEQIMAELEKFAINQKSKRFIPAHMGIFVDDYKDYKDYEIEVAVASAVYDREIDYSWEEISELDYWKYVDEIERYHLS